MNLDYNQLLEAGVHFGHLTRKWNPAMKPYIFMQRNDIHIIDLMKTEKMMEESCRAAKQLAFTGRKILYVGTKKQAQEIIQDQAKRVDMPYANERWLGGMLTNFATVRRSIKRMQQIEKMEEDGTFEMLLKRERLSLTREKAKLDRVLGGIADLNRLPSALFIVDIVKEHIAIHEARKLNIPTIAIVDTNSDPNKVDFPIPGNDDAAASIELITRTLTDSIAEGLEERKQERDMELRKQAEEADAAAEGREPAESDEDVQAPESSESASEA